MSTSTYIVKHPRLMLAVEGKLQHMKPGTPVSLTAKSAKKLGNKVTAAPTAEPIDLAGGDTELEALRAKAASLNIEGASRWGEARLKKEIDKVEKAIADAEAVLNS